MAERDTQTTTPGRRWTFEEGPTTSVSREVALTPLEVWKRVSDITWPVATSPELQRVEWIGEADGPRVGERFVGHNERGDFRWSVTCLVTECEPGRAFAWDALVDPDAEEPQAQSSWRFDVEPVDGGSRVTQTVMLGPGRSGVTWAIREDPEAESDIIDRRLRGFEKAMSATLDTLA